MNTKDEVLTSERVLLALDRVLMSRAFVHSTRLSLFLRFAVEHALQGKAGELKEYTIGTQVYARRDDFDPALDTIVRSEARRLRRKLKEYYDTEGRREEVVIALLPGSYVPVHRIRVVPTEYDGYPAAPVSIAVEPFECDRANPLASECAFGISDDILHRLADLAGIDVICGSSSCPSQDGATPDVAFLDRRAGLVLRGTVRADDNVLRVTARAMTVDRRVLWSHRVDSLVAGTGLIHLQETVATEVLIHIGPWLSGLQHLGRDSHNGNSLLTTFYENPE